MKSNSLCFAGMSKSSEPEAAGSLRDKFNIVGGWLASLTCVFDQMGNAMSFFK